jgi:hypothetical protein
MKCGKPRNAPLRVVGVLLEILAEQLSNAI